MKYVIRQKLFSLGDRYTVKDGAGTDRFMVRGALVSITRKVSILGMDGTELYEARRKLLSLLPCYRISRNGAEVARLRQRLSLWGSRYAVTGQPGAYTIKGRPLEYDYAISKGEAMVATISKRFFSLADSYGVEVAEEEDAAFIIALVVIIDQLAHEHKTD